MKYKKQGKKEQIKDILHKKNTKFNFFKNVQVKKEFNTYYC